MPETRLETVRSADGTQIAVERGGAGPHLVLVHGTSASRRRWDNFRPLIEPHLTVWAMDRRGRGDSGDPVAPYAIEREFEDVAAVVNAIGAPVILFGHSYGGLCSLGAIGQIADLAALIVYEAPALEGGNIPEPVIARMETALAAGDRESVISIFCEEVVRMRPNDIAALRASPAWAARLAAAHTLPRELRAAGSFSLAAAHPEQVAVPTLLLHGGDSPPFFTEAMARIAQAIPHGETVVLDGQQHVAMDTAPEMLAKAVTEFWSGARRAG